MEAAISLRSGLEHELDGFAYVRESLKLTVRAWLYRQQTTEWLKLLNSHPMFKDMLASSPRLVNKIYRSYFSTSLSCDARLDALKTHYGVVIDAGLESFVVRAAHGPVALCRIDGKFGDDYHLALRSASVSDREGDLTLQLMHGEELVYSVAFSFVSVGSKLAIGIGCLQGPPGDAGLERIRLATRAMHGLRPKNLLVRLVRQLGHEFGCAEVVLVSNRNRVVTKSMRAGRVHANYDELWEELQARPLPSGDYALPCEPLAPPRLEEIASKKRSEARKRYEMQVAAIEAIRTRLARSRSPATAVRSAHAYHARRSS
jgi:uncharacterized protein VirK/YbjX